MQQWIVKNADGEVVGKYEQHTEPESPTDGSVERVDDVDDYGVVEWWMD